MADNCLVTKLKGSVDDKNLPILGEIKLGFNEDGRNWSRITLAGGVTGGIILYSDNYFKDENLTVPEDGASFTGKKNLYGKGVEGALAGEIGITPKYSITQIILSNGSFIKDIADMRYMPDTVELEIVKSLNAAQLFQSGDINQLADRVDYGIKVSGWQDVGILNKFINFTKVTGSIEMLKKFDLVDTQMSVYCGKLVGSPTFFGTLNENWKANLGTLHFPTQSTYELDLSSLAGYNLSRAYLNSGNVYGNIVSTLGGMYNLYELSLKNHTDAEDLKDFLDALHTAGKTSGTLHMVTMGTNKTLNGEPYSGEHTATFTVEGWTIV